MGIVLFPVVDKQPPVDRRGLAHSGTHAEQGKPDALPTGK